MNRRAFFEGLHKGESDTSFHFIQCYQSVHQQTDFWRGTIITLNLNIIFREPKEPSLKCLRPLQASIMITNIFLHLVKLRHAPAVFSGSTAVHHQNLKLKIILTAESIFRMMHSPNQF